MNKAELDVCPTATEGLAARLGGGGVAVLYILEGKRTAEGSECRSVVWDHAHVVGKKNESKREKRIETKGA